MKAGRGIANWKGIIYLPGKASNTLNQHFFLNVFALVLNIVGFYVYVVTVNSLLLNAVSGK